MQLVFATAGRSFIKVKKHFFLDFAVNMIEKMLKLHPPLPSPGKH